MADYNIIIYQRTLTFDNCSPPSLAPVHTTTPRNVFVPVAIYLGFWTLSLGTFAYNYCKIHDYPNRFNKSVDSIWSYFCPPKDVKEQLLDEIANFDPEELNDIHVEVKVEQLHDQVMTELVNQPPKVIEVKEEVNEEPKEAFTATNDIKGAMTDSDSDGYDVVKKTK